MERIAVIPYKITTEIKGKLQTLVKGVVDTFKIKKMKIDQKLKLLQITSQYILPRLKSVYTEQVKEEDSLLFVDKRYIGAKNLRKLKVRFNCKKKPLTEVKGFMWLSS
tara:strand:- start:33 stop:356 length:324 start_codon:yes stop_codon:yes gene_type:complete